MAVMIRISSEMLAPNLKKEGMDWCSVQSQLPVGHVLCSALFESGLCFLSSSLNVLVFSLLKYNSWKSGLENEG